MKKPYEIPEAELIVLHADTAIAVIPGTDGDKARNTDDIGGDGGLGESGGVTQIPGRG